jgi:ABC-type uncharacterized transport system substrate-binding protein
MLWCRHRFLAVLPAALVALSAAPAAAHPHVFIDTNFEVIFDAEGRASALRVTWTYDEMYSMLVVEERGLDPDYDLVLTPDEKTALQGFDSQWEEGFEGASYALLGEQALKLGPPTDWTASYEGGKLVSTHMQTIDPPLAVAADPPLVLQAYDPSFYVAFRIEGTPLLTGREDCAVQVFEPDLDAADAMMKAALDELSGDMDAETQFPAVGAAYSDEARVTCGAPS